jgi:hypothetical protein
MPTFSELGQSYAERIKAALAKDGFTTTSRISASDLPYSSTLRELKAIKSDIDGLVYTESRKALSESDKGRVLIEIQKQLYLPNVRQIERMVEFASNDDLSDLADTIENILKGRD